MTDWDRELDNAAEGETEARGSAQSALSQNDAVERELLRRGAEQPANDFGNGQRMRIYFGGDLMFVARLGWFHWNGSRWAQDFDGMAVRRCAHQIQRFIKREAFAIEPSAVESAVLEAGLAALPDLNKLKAKPKLSGPERIEFERLKDLFAKSDLVRAQMKDRRNRHLRLAKSAGNTGPLSNMIKEAEIYVERRIEDLNRNPLSINTEKVVIELEEADIDPHEAEWCDPAYKRKYVIRTRAQERGDLITKAMKVVYDRDAECPLFLKFLNDIQPNPDMRAFLQRWLGYSLTGLTSEQKLVFLHGSGRNGKSTLVDLIAKMMSEYATTVPIESLTGTEMRKGGDATPDLVRLPGARMVRASEPEEGIRFREATVKSFTGGEPILVRKMREEFIEIDPIFKLTISGNHKPNVRGTDDGIWRRILLVPFDCQIPREDVDPLLPQKLWRERAGILNWLLVGAEDFLNGGLREPEGVTSATEEFREDSDPVRMFLIEGCEISGDAEDFEMSRDLVAAFQAYQRDQGAQPWGNQTVSKRLREKAGIFRVNDQAYSPFRTAAASGYRGIRLTPAMRDRLAESREGRWQGASNPKKSPDLDGFV